MNPTLNGTGVYLLAVENAEAIQRLASDPLLAATTRIPHPYPEDGARDFIARMLARRAEGTGYGFVIMDGHEVVGIATLTDIGGDEARRLGGWIGRPYQGRGFATYGVRMVLEFGFNNLQLARIGARALEGHLAARRVLEKHGFELMRLERSALELPRHPDARDEVYQIHRRRWNEVRHGPMLARLHPGLREILDAELKAGNEVMETSDGWPDADSVFVRLRQAFRTAVEPGDGVAYSGSNDPHWWRAEYRSSSPRHLLVY